MLTPDQAVQIGTEAVRTRYAGSDFGFVAGSIVRGEGTETSDVDLVVLYAELPNAWREAFSIDGHPVEAFVHDHATLRWFVDKEVSDGRASLLGMINEGRVVGPRPEAAQRWRSEALAALFKGPPPLSKARLDDLRYEITDKLDDLAAPRPPDETSAIAVALYMPLAELILRARGQWFGRSKWIPRLMARADPRLAEQFQHAFQTLFREANAHRLLELSRTELQSVGGPLFDGFRREAAPSARTGEQSTPDSAAPDHRRSQGAR